jgi:heat shock protein HslJ
MTLLARTLPVLAALALSLPILATAQSGGAASQPTPNRRAADPVLVRSLQDNVWTLQSAAEASGQPIDGLIVPGRSFVLRFDGARLAVTGGCNNMTGSWRLSPQGQLTAGRLAATMKACEPALMKADAALSAVLAQPLDAQLHSGAAPSLRLVSATRQTLVLSGQPTLESLYGAPKRMFLEVAPQTVPCQPGAGGSTQCLQVRERRFDEQGLRIEPPGEWGAFYGRIDGYTHTPGVRNVLRVKRYQRTQVPADASRYVFVLDLVVESEIVK